MMTVHVRGAQRADWPAVCRLLEDAGLPVEDLGPAAMAAFLVAAGPDGVAGAVGLEVLGRQALLRSLVVAPGRTRGGIGAALLAAAEERAARAAIDEIWLLTIDAQDYFAARGYRVRERSETPSAIRKTPEFASLCPASAALMSRRLAAG